MPDEKYTVENEAQLAEIIGEPMEFLQMKVLPSLDDTMRDYIAASPLVFVATLDADGRPDVSPKGDPAGFVQVDETGRLVIPERPGNRLTFGFRNILRDGRIGLIFCVPGERETLRIKGRATLHRDPQLLEALSVNGKPALMYTYVEVQECFFHCGKAMIRSRAWKPESWQPPERSLMARQFARAMEGDAAMEQSLAAEIEKNYDEELY
ncbi:MAG: pyridoxamine 5'-phosphate oxidase family protein [Halioglobus sp.]|nr:pyridoxamine 5'-phosphate oxidase family protein [Halioglobus sp.]